MYLLDTNICIYLIKEKASKLIQRIEKEKPFHVFVSSVTVAELEYAVYKSFYPEKNRITLIKFLSSYEIVPFTHFDSEKFGQIKAYLESLGKLIEPNEIQIAAQGVCRGLTVVTNNIREFESVPNLIVENWV